MTRKTASVKEWRRCGMTRSEGEKVFAAPWGKNPEFGPSLPRWRRLRGHGRGFLVRDIKAV
jgi:hypothetical protein